MGGLVEGRGSVTPQGASEKEEVEGEEEEWRVVHRSSTDTQAAVGHIVDSIARLTCAESQRGNPPLIALGERWLAQAKTMPDSLLTLPLPDAVRRILGNTSLRYLEELKIEQYIHLSPGVTVPRDIAFQISVGAKYIFHQPTNANLITEAWKDIIMIMLATSFSF